MSAYTEGMDVGKPATFRRMLRTMCPPGSGQSASQERRHALEVRTAEHLEHALNTHFLHVKTVACSASASAAAPASPTLLPFRNSLVRMVFAF